MKILFLCILFLFAPLLAMADPLAVSGAVMDSVTVAPDVTVPVEKGHSLIVLLIVGLSGLLGAYLHWRSVNARGDSDSFHDYMLVIETSKTGNAVMGFYITMQTAWNVGLFDKVGVGAFVDDLQNLTLNPAMAACVGASIMAGMAFDSKFNSGGTPVAPPAPLTPASDTAATAGADSAIAAH